MASAFPDQTLPPTADASEGVKRALEYLTNIPAWYLATSVDDQPHVRPFSFAAEQDGKIWFCTATMKDVWDELVQNPRQAWRTTPGRKCAKWATATSRRWAKATKALTTRAWCSSPSKSRKLGSAVMAKTTGIRCRCNLRTR